MNTPNYEMDEMVAKLNADNAQAVINEYQGKSVEQIEADLNKWNDDGDNHEFATEIHQAIERYTRYHLTAAASTMGRKGGASTSERKVTAARANGQKGGRPRRSLYDRAISKMERLGFCDDDIDFTFADWREGGGDEHYKWLIKSTKSEIASWIESGR